MRCPPTGLALLGAARRGGRGYCFVNSCCATRSFKQQLPGYLKTGFEAVFVKPVARPGTAVRGIVLTLQMRELALRADGGSVKNRMRVVKFTHDLSTRNLPRWIQ